jgi:hypothetical protein
MSAEIIQLADVRHSRMGDSTGSESVFARAGSSDNTPRFHFWTGASGKRYVHTVYSLFDCPPLEAANYVLVKRTSKSSRTLLAIGRLTNETASLNLAEIRQRAATLGADEVHVHLLAGSSRESQAVEVDLKSAQFAAKAL